MKIWKRVCALAVFLFLLCNAGAEERIPIDFNTFAIQNAEIAGDGFGSLILNIDQNGSWVEGLIERNASKGMTFYIKEGSMFSLLSIDIAKPGHSPPLQVFQYGIHGNGEGITFDYNQDVMNEQLLSVVVSAFQSNSADIGKVYLRDFSQVHVTAVPEVNMLSMLVFGLLLTAIMVRRHVRIIGQH